MSKQNLTSEQQLCKAIWEDADLELIKEIISSISTLNYLDEYGKSPLYLSVEKNRTEIIELLCSKGASPDFDNGYSEIITPRRLAADKNINMELFNTHYNEQTPWKVKINLYEAFGGEENFLSKFGQGGTIDITIPNNQVDHIGDTPEIVIADTQ